MPISIRDFRMAALNPDFTDEEIADLYLKVKIADKELLEISKIFHNHRPGALIVLAQKYPECFIDDAEEPEQPLN